MKFIAATDVGSVRENNEDSYYIPGSVENLFIVADGMGGHLAGETASSMAVSLVSEYLMEASDIEIEQRLINAVKIANHEIYKLSSEDLKYRGMGTTLTLAYVHNDDLYYVNIGDSRMYKINENEIKQITVDDSYVGYLIQIGEITEDEAKDHPKKNVLTKALGTMEEVDVKVEKIKLDDSKYLLCSDGLTNMINNKNIGDIILNNDLEVASKKLIDEAIKNGGIDNITFIIMNR